METVYLRRRGVWWGFNSQLPCDAALRAAGKGWGDILVVERGTVEGLGEPPPHLTFFQDGRDGYLFVVINGVRFSAQSRDRETIGGAYKDTIGVPPGTYEWIPNGGRYRNRLGVPLTSRLSRELVWLHRGWTQQFVWIGVGAIIGGALGPLGEWIGRSVFALAS